MNLFTCQSCGQILHFENTRCLGCGRSTGFIPAEMRMVAVEADGPGWRIASGGTGSEPGLWRFCSNWELSACNWLVPDGGPEGGAHRCPACAHNRTVPDLSDPERLVRWQRIESAKRRLIHGLMRLGLPLPLPGSGHPEPLVFDFLADDPSGEERVLTGHADGVITLSLTEAGDAEREKMRVEMGEAYRTLLGHFRHEIGHYYWDLLVRDGAGLDAFRTLFGDERTDYAEALAQRYREGPPADWAQHHVSAYASVHPWEDWAETWAHYLHMVDTLDTARAFGLQIDPGLDDTGALTAGVDLDPYRAQSFADLVRLWPPLTVAMNAMNRSMGQPDLYPFALPASVLARLEFVHDLIGNAGQSRPYPI